MLRSFSALLTIAILCASGLAAESEHGSGLGKRIGVPSNLGFVTNVSDDRQAVTIIFDNLIVEVSPAQTSAVATHNQTAIQTKVATLNIPYKTDHRSVTMTMDLRSFADADSAASARLVACAGDKTTVVDLSGDKAKKVDLKGKSKCALAAEHAETQFGDWQDQVEFTVQTQAKEPVLQITLFLLVEHDTDAADAGGALLAVDSLDLEIGKAGVASYEQ